MNINDKELSVFSAKLIDRTISTNGFNSVSDWLPGAVSGQLLFQSYDFKTINLTFLIKETNEDTAYKKIALLTSELKDCQLRFDDINLVFPCFLDSRTEPERLKNGKFKVTYTLKNTWGIGEKQEKEFELTTVNCKPITVNYILNWKNTMETYSNCFDKQEQEELLTQQTVWVNLETLDAVIAASQSWDALLLNLGIDLQAYRPENAVEGTTYTQEEYSTSNAKALITSGEVNVVYMRYHKDGYQDFPEANYPSLVWTVGKGNKYYIDLGMGNEWDIRDISIYVTGRYFQTVIDGNGCIVGAGKDNPFNINFNNPNAVIETDTVATDRYTTKVIQTTTSGGEIMFQTLESLSGLPFRKYGFRSSIDSTAPIPGYTDLIFNGVTLDRVPIDSYILTKNLTIMYGEQGIGNYIDIARVQVYYKGELMLDAVPINGHVKNGFANNYDDGFYDTVNMKFLPWVNYASGEAGPGPGGTIDPDTPEDPDTPVTVKGEILLSKSTAKDGSTITFPVGTVKTVDWDTDPPQALASFAAVYSVKDVTGTWTYSSSKGFTKYSEGTLSDGRYYATFNVTSSTAKTGCYITFTPADGSEAITQNFSIASLY